MINRAIHKTRRGFTLVELLITIGIFGLIAALGVPAFGSFIRSSRLSGATNELASDIQYARSLALSRRQTFHIEFAGPQYRVVETASGTIVRQRDLPGGLTLTSTDTPTFYAWGLADAASITLSKSGRSKTVVLSANGMVEHY